MHNLIPVLSDYIPILFMLVIAVLLASALLGISYLLGPRKVSEQKLTPYESGITPFSDARGRFSIRYYLIGASFILFDIEVAFLLAWAVTMRELALIGFFVAMPFLLLLLLGFLYEWKRGVLEWE